MRMHSMPSPSSRRAWIEIPARCGSTPTSQVALLAEGVDRNSLVRKLVKGAEKSPSSRRAWIEIRISTIHRKEKFMVALLAEGVDRNRTTTPQSVKLAGRPPRGGRG